MRDFRHILKCNNVRVLLCLVNGRKSVRDPDEVIDLKRFGNQVRYAPILAGVLIALAVLFSHAYGISARTHDGAHANLSAEVVDGGVLLSWKAPLAGEVTAYRILRRYGSESAELGVLVEDTGSALTRYVDSSARPGTEYVYRVQPIGSDGVGSRSNFARLKTPPFAFVGASADEPMPDDLPPLRPPADASDATRGFSLVRGTESTSADSFEVTAGAFWVAKASDNKIYIFERSGSSVTYNSSPRHNAPRQQQQGSGECGRTASRCG